MKNFLIFLSIFIVVFFVAADLEEKIKDMDNLTMKTPAQVEMKENQFNQQNDKNYQNDFNKFEHKDSQNNNNHPQYKHKEFKTYR